MHIITSAGIFPLPYPSERGKLFGIVKLHPGGILNRSERRCIDRYEFGYFNIEADPFPPDTPGLRPSDFDLKTLKWALHSATLIVVWGGDIPFDRGHFTRTLRAHVRPGGKIALVLVRDAHHDEWTGFAAKHARQGAEFLLIKGLPGLPSGMSCQTCATSGAVH